MAFLGTCLPAGRRSSQEFAWFLRQLAEKNSEDGAGQIPAGGFARVSKSPHAPRPRPSLAAHPLASSSRESPRPQSKAKSSQAGTRKSRKDSELQSGAPRWPPKIKLPPASRAKESGRDVPRSGARA